MKKPSIFLLLILCLLAACVPSAMGQEIQKDGLLVTLETDQLVYQADDPIQALLSVENQGNAAVDHVVLQISAPRGYQAAAGQADTLEKTTLAPGEKAELSLQLLVRRTPLTGDDSHLMLWACLLLAAGAGIFALRKSGRRIISLLLCLALAGGCLPCDTALAAARGQIDIQTEVEADGKIIPVCAAVYYGGPAADGTYQVAFDSRGGSTVASQHIPAGEQAARPSDPTREGYAFVGWYADPDETDWDHVFDFSGAITSNVTLYAKWSSMADTDKEGLTDGLEEYYGTDPEKADTDGDGISDYDEIIAGQDPLKRESGTDDADGDGLTNAQEARLGTLSTFNDTDTDGLTDADEINRYGTSPTNADTDGDGASDGAEIRYGTDPLKKNTVFDITGKLQADQGASPSVRLSLMGSQVDSLHIAPVEDDTFFGDDVPGMLGKAYDFSVNGDFNQATIQFEFDRAALGSDQAAIYYFNEEKQLLEELPTTINGNIASAQVNHFSIYILLNKTQFDQVWDTEIKPPDMEVEEDASLDIVFVIDYSLSMEYNDPNQLCKKVAKEFVEKLRDGVDRAAVVKFIRRATLVSGLTTDKESLLISIGSIAYDNGLGTYSGTDGSAGIHMGLSQLSSSDAEYKYIVFVTDGEDNGYSYSYDNLISSAVSNGVNIYTVGMGSASASVLRRVADGTGGKYYHATAIEGADDVLDLDEVFDKIESETIDYTTDSNMDGISDYFTKMLCDGSIRFGTGKSNPFYAQRISYEAVQNGGRDYDGDGIRNGDELILSYNAALDRVYLQMTTNPAMKDTDYDGYPDNNDLHPLTWDISDRDLLMCTSMSYSFLPSGSNLTSLSSSMRNEVNRRFKGQTGWVHGSVSEMKGWKVVDTWYAKGGLQALAFQKDKNIIMAYRGTEPDFGDWKDWFNNGTTYVLSISTHTPAAKKFMLQTMKKYPGYNFYVTGHSLGGHLTYNAAAEGINYDIDAIKGVTTFNGLGLCLGLTLFGDVWDEAQLMKKTYVIRDYKVDGDPVSRGPLGATTFHYGTEYAYPKRYDADGAHDLYNFLVDIDPRGRFEPYLE